MMLPSFQAWESSGSESGPCAVVMAPMMAEWDDGAFCAPLTLLLLARGYRVSIYDTMSVADECSSLPQAAARWAEILTARHPHIDLAVGQAYGGALIQYLLADALVACPRVLGISAPTYCDDVLRANLCEVLDELLCAGPEAALQMLECKVLPYSRLDRPMRPQSAPPMTVSRLYSGLTHLGYADARAQVTDYPGNVLWLYGEESRLIRGDNIIPAPYNALQRSVGLPHCGMRPLNDAKDTSLALIENFLDETKS